MGAHKNLFTALFVPVLAMAILGLSTAANAAVVRYDSRATFNQNISGVIQEYSFDSLSFGSQTNPLVFVDREEASFISSGDGLFTVADPDLNSVWFLAASAATGGFIRIDFTAGVSAVGLDVGIYLNSVGTYNAANPITFLYRLWYANVAQPSVGTIDFGNLDEFSFLGFTSGSGNLNRLELEITTPGTALAEAIDNVTLGVAASSSVVPVPAALPLFGTGLALMGFFGWRRKRRAA